jgi:predicted Zn finger-like uncharacterized protein
VITICPQCQLSLAVSAADLRIAQGHVRCGRCASVFNALVSLYDTEADVLAPPTTEAAPEAALEPAQADGSDTRIFEVKIDTALADGGANTGVFDRVPIATEAPAPTPPDAAAFDPPTFEAPEFEPPRFAAPLIDTAASADAIDVIELDDHSPTGEAPALQSATAADVAPGPSDGIDLAIGAEPVAANDALLEMPPAANDAGIDEVVAANDPFLLPDRLDIDFDALEPTDADQWRVVPQEAATDAPFASVIEAPAAVATAAEPASADIVEMDGLDALEPPRPRHYWIYAAGSALLALVFAGQLIHHQREALIAWPALSGPLSRLYAAIGQPIRLRGDLGAYDLRQLGAFAPPDAAGTLLVRASLRNLSPRPQPMPLLRVTLQDRYGNRIASRDLSAAEYQQRPAGTAPETLLAAGARLETAVQLVDPGGNAVGFELDVCLAEGGGTRCANETATATASR